MNSIPFSMSDLPLTLEAGYIKTSKSFLPKSKVNKYYILLYLIHGEFIIYEEENQFHLTPGSLCIFSPNTKIYSTDYTKSSASWYYIYFHLQTPSSHHIDIKEYLPIMTSSTISPASYQCTLPLPKFTQFQPDSPMQRKIEYFLELYHSKDPYHFGYQNALLLEIILDICKYQSAGKPPHYDSSIVDFLLQYLNNHIFTPFCSEDIARALNMNYHYLCEIFKKNTGITMQTHHTRLKMREAERFLKNTDLNISEISSRLGYQDPLYFSNVFKKHHQLSPKKYREKNHSYESL